MKKLFDKYQNNKRLVHLVLLFIFLMVISFVFVYKNFSKEINEYNEILYLG
jgi:hypothetical protein